MNDNLGRTCIRFVTLGFMKLISSNNLKYGFTAITVIDTNLFVHAVYRT